MTPEDEAELTPEEIQCQQDIEARRQWLMNESGVSATKEVMHEIQV